MKNEDKNTTGLKIPYRLVSTVEMSRTLRELKMLDTWLTQATLRAGGQAVKAPKTSTTLEELAALNGVSLLEKPQREAFISELAQFAETAPKIHMSFAVEPSAQFLNHMIVWLRTNIHPSLLLEVGLQPTLAAGCMVRTTNKMFDLSLRNRFHDSRPLLVQSIAKFQQQNQTPVTAAAGEPTPSSVSGETSPSAPQSAAATPPSAEAQVQPAETVQSNQPQSVETAQPEAQTAPAGETAE